MYAKGTEAPHLYVDLQYIFFEIYACTEVCELQPKDAFQRLQIVEARVCHMAWKKCACTAAQVGVKTVEAERRRPDSWASHLAAPH